MIERQGRILSIANGEATIRIDMPTACARCGLSTCAGRAGSVSLSAPPGARPGDAVTLALPEAALLRGALLVYLLPAAATLVGAIALAFAGDSAAVAGAACGLGLGLIIVRLLGRRVRQIPHIFVSHPLGDSR
ncbi:SoxR reducing system RseC family protein [Caldichromatium japonicum]|uniref:SoxR reducing system RseC family protein n=1 Tax=Caldichromatium japonicum TaxID=2699430 RepID=A0A6G7VFC8_9GAMM|nr:SoxR reducing system RseC family protein [Caldichromatium japonicum]QIK38576.1 SoxR reducing system RseC family protein [Caldichromatium japonicum]